MATKIGIISDTHGLLRPEVTAVLQDCGCIIHGGDINKPEIIEELKAIAPLYVVRGNNDKEWAEHLPAYLTFQIEALNFYLVHNKKDIAKSPEALAGIDVVIYGHSHKYAEEIKDGRLWLNPGSCGRRRFDQEITFAVMEVDGKETKVKKITIVPETAGKNGAR